MRITSAPSSDSIRPARGTGPSPAISMTRSPASGPGFCPDRSTAVMPVTARGLFRRHADGAVETDRLAVEHLIFNDVQGEGSIFGRLTEPRGERDRGPEGILHLLRHP